MRKTFFRNFIGVSTIIALCMSHQLHAQRQYDANQPTVGEPIPQFELSDVQHYPLKKVTQDDFKGKWLFLTFWSIKCMGSINAMKKINKWQQEFKRETVWMMVGLNNSRYKMRPQGVFEQLKKRDNLHLAVAYDSVLAQRWDFPGTPHIIIIDPKGVVRFLTNGTDMDAGKIKKLIHGEDVNFFDDMAVSKRPIFNPNILNTDNTDVKNTLLQRSILTKWNGEAMHGGYDLKSWLAASEATQERGFTFTGMNLASLYNVAYRGQYHWWNQPNGNHMHYVTPTLEIPDKSLFEFNNKTGQGIYTYNLYLPKEKRTKENIMRIMQEDLRRTFGYTATIVKQQKQVWKLVAKPGAIEKLKTKGEPKSSYPQNFYMGFTVKNYPPESLIRCVSVMLISKYFDPFVPFIDETGLAENFDLTMEGDMGDINNVKQELQKHGLDLVLAYKEMFVLLIQPDNIQAP